MTEQTRLSPLEHAAIINKLTAARTRLILDKPFLGALVLRLPLQAAHPAWCPTTGTDARKFYYNPAYVQELRPDEAQFVLAHEALHCALSHFARRQHRVKHRWDIACDYAINPILLADGLTPPPGILMLKEYAGMTAEEIYPLIADNDLSETLDQHLYDKEDNPAEGGQSAQDEPSDAETDPGQGGSDRPPPPLNQQEAEELAVQWRQRLAGAAQQAQQAGKLSGILQRLVEEFLQPRLPWRSLLAHYMSAVARDDYSYMRPSARRGGDAIFPTLKSQQINAVVALDVSGSVTPRELRECLSEINAIKGQVRAAITLLACDAAIVEGFPCRFEPWEEATLPEKIAGGGNTDFRPVFDWLARQDQAPDLLIYFTDAQGLFPAAMPAYQVLWLVKGRSSVPWGTRVQLN